MLRPPARSSHSHTRNPPQIHLIDDDHPLSTNAKVLGRLQETPQYPSAFASHDNLPARFPDPCKASSDENSDADTTPFAENSDLLKLRHETKVYVHRVQRTDTFPKIILQYRISADVLRRANGMWASDSINFKDTLLLPISECHITPESIHPAFPALIPDMDQSIPNDVEVGKIQMENFACPDIELIGSTSRKEGKLKENYRVVQQVFIDGIGCVHVAVVPESVLRFFPPSKHNNKDDHIDLTRPSIDQNRETHASNRAERGSLDALRIGAGQLVADAYNGTQGLIRRMKDKKHLSEIDLIEL